MNESCGAAYQRRDANDPSRYSAEVRDPTRLSHREGLPCDGHRATASRSARIGRNRVINRPVVSAAPARGDCDPGRVTCGGPRTTSRSRYTDSP